MLRLIRQTIQSAHASSIPCGMCGEAAGDPLLIPALLGMGLDEFSMSSGSVLRSRKIVSMLQTGEAQQLVDELLTLPTTGEVEKALIRFAETRGLT